MVRPGMTFSRRLIDDISKTVSHPDHHIRLSAGARSDLARYQLFVESWNGISLMSAAHRRLPEVKSTSDTSGAWGVVDIGTYKWFS